MTFSPEYVELQRRLETVPPGILVTHQLDPSDTSAPCVHCHHPGLDTVRGCDCYGCDRLRPTGGLYWTGAQGTRPRGPEKTAGRGRPAA